MKSKQRQRSKTTRVLEHLQQHGEVRSDVLCSACQCKPATLYYLRETGMIRRATLHGCNEHKRALWRITPRGSWRLKRAQEESA